MILSLSLLRILESVFMDDSDDISSFEILYHLCLLKTVFQTRSLILSYSLMMPECALKVDSKLFTLISFDNSLCA